MLAPHMTAAALALLHTSALHGVINNNGVVNHSGASNYNDVISSCSVHYLDQKLDQLSRGTSETFKQRYFVCESPKSKRSKHKDSAADRPVLFYCGNEADVTLYLNATGLMWESASKLDDA